MDYLTKIRYAAIDLSDELIRNFDKRLGTSHAIQAVGKHYLEAFFDYEFPERNWLKVVGKPNCTNIVKYILEDVMSFDDVKFECEDAYDEYWDEARAWYNIPYYVNF